MRTTAGSALPLVDSPVCYVQRSDVKRGSNLRTVHIVPSLPHDIGLLEIREANLARAVDLVREALLLLRTQPTATFVIEQVLLLEAFVTRYPDALTELRTLAQSGRLEAACGMYVTPDSNMPSGESLVRQAVTGQRWLGSRLGVQAATCWLADCWGHPSTLPGLLRHCGYRHFIFWRGKPPWLSVSEFRWRGLDGSELTCHWTSIGVGADRYPGGARAGQADRVAPPPDELRRHAGEAATYAVTSELFLPTGNNSLTPQELTLAGVERLNQVSTAELRFQYSTPDRFFAAVEAAGQTLPLLEGELNPVAQGVYSSRIALKQLNRRLESALAAAEKANTLLWLDGGDYPRAQVDEAWRLTLANQRHDVIAGAIVDSAYQEAVADYRSADGLVTRLLMDAVDRAMARRVGHHSGLGIFAFNPLPRPRTEVLRLNTMAIGWSTYRVVDSAGKELPVQLGSDELIFQAQLPPLGYATFALRTAPESPRREHGPAPATVETDHYRIRLNGGIITSLVDRASDFEYVDPERPYWNDLVLQNDNGDLWLLYDAPLNERLRTTTPLHDPYPASASDDDPVFRAGIASHTGSPTVELIEDGAVRSVIRSRFTLRCWANSADVVQYVIIYRQLRRIDFRTELTGHGKRYRVRVAFPTAIRRGKIVHSVPFGQVERPEGEYPAQSWFGYAGDSAVVYMLSRGLPGANVTDGVLMLSLLRSAAMEYKGPSMQGYEDGVRHTFTYSVLPADAAHPAEPWWEADALNSPPLAITAADVRPGDEPRLRIEPRHVMLTALYLDGDQLTARLHEAAGVACDASIWLAGLTGCRETDALTLDGPSLPVDGETVTFHFKPFQIKTLRMEVRRGTSPPGPLSGAERGPGGEVPRHTTRRRARSIDCTDRRRAMAGRLVDRPATYLRASPGTLP